MNLLIHLRIAAFCGALVGATLGAVDLLVRITSRYFEWFELYLALLLPMLTFVLVFLFIALLREVFLLLRRQKRSVADHTAWYASLLISVALLVGGQVLINLFLFPDQSFYDGNRLEGSLLFGFLALFLFFFLTNRAPQISSKLLGLTNRIYLGAIASNLLFFLSFFTLFCAAIDIFGIYSIPPKPKSATTTAATPNIIVITLDTVRPDHLGPYGYGRNTTPFLTQFSSESVIFDNAISTTSWTLPSHASLFTGKFNFRHGATEHHQVLDQEQITIAELLRDRGYETAGFVGGPYCKAKFGMAQGFHTYKDRLDFFEFRFTKDSYSTRRLLEFLSPWIVPNILGADGEMTAPEVNAHVGRWVDRGVNQPYFLFINYFDAHDPYVLGHEYRSEFTDERRSDQEIRDLLTNYYYDAEKRYKEKSLSPETIEYIKALYDAELKFLDHHLSVLFKKLQSANLLDNTVIFITADHGEEFMEHGGVVHKQTLYEESIRIPLIIKFPNGKRSVRIPARVGITDLYDTIRDLTGLSTHDGPDAESLIPFIDGEKTARDAPLLSELDIRDIHGGGEITALSDPKEGWKLIEVPKPQPRIPSGLYHLPSDVGEKINLLEREKARSAEMSSYIQKIR